MPTASTKKKVVGAIAVAVASVGLAASLGSEPAIAPAGPEYVQPVVQEVIAVKEMIAGKGVKERATIKGQEIAKRVKPFARKSIGDYDVEITEIEAIEGGIQYFARAWDSNGEQIGFGKDGTVDIERFRVYNPPILVPDGTTYQFISEDGDEREKKNYKEDVQEALLQALEHTIRVTGKFGDENIIEGKRGNTTTTVYPDAHVETNSCDGYARRTGVDESFATIIAGAGNGATAEGGEMQPRISATTTTDQFSRNQRSFILFDTSAVGSDTVDSVVLSVFGNDKFNGFTEEPELDIVASTPASNTDIVSADYAQLGSTVFGSVAYASFSTVGYNDITLNASGEANIDGSGISKFGASFNWDIDGSFGGTWASASNVRVTANTAETTGGTTEDPKLVITHSAAAATFVPLIIMIE